MSTNQQTLRIESQFSNNNNFAIILNLEKYFFSIVDKIVNINIITNKSIIKLAGIIVKTIDVILAIALVILLSIPIVLLTGLSIYLSRKLAIDFRNNKVKMLEEIALLDYPKVIEVENDIQKLLIHIDKVISIIEKPTYISLFKSMHKYYKMLKTDATEIKNTCVAQYTITLKEIHPEKEVRENYVKTLSVFNDIWDYEETEEEKEVNKKIMFEFKKQLSENASAV